MNQKQVEAVHYNFLSYVNEERFCSYYKQIEEIIKSNAKTLLLIGMGDGIVSHLLTKIRPDLQITTLDFASDLYPDICCDIRELSDHVKEKFDAVLCCQVLEHLPYEDFENILQQIKSVLSPQGTFILSLPDGGIEIRFLIHFPKLKYINSFKRLCRYHKKDFPFNGEHYWEINVTKDYPLKRIKNSIEKFYHIQREYLVENNTYHRFFILDNK